MFLLINSFRLLWLRNYNIIHQFLGQRIYCNIRFGNVINDYIMHLQFVREI